MLDKNKLDTQRHGVYPPPIFIPPLCDIYSNIYDISPKLNDFPIKTRLYTHVIWYIVFGD